MKIQIPFLNGEETLVYTADSIAEAVAQAIKNKDELKHADLGRASFVDADLSRTNLRGVGLYRANLAGANLSHADLRRADLREANLRGVGLYRANLSWANLRRANLTHADLSRTDLRYTDLTGAYLEDAILHRADLRYAKVQDNQLWTKRPFLSMGACGAANRTTLVFFFEDRSEPFIMCGCFKGGLKEFKARIKKTHSGTFHEVEYNAMVDYIEALYKEQQEN